MAIEIGNKHSRRVPTGKLPKMPTSKLHARMNKSSKWNCFRPISSSIPDILTWRLTNFNFWAYPHSPSMGRLLEEKRRTRFNLFVICPPVTLPTHYFNAVGSPWKPSWKGRKPGPKLTNTSYVPLHFFWGVSVFFCARTQSWRRPFRRDWNERKLFDVYLNSFGSWHERFPPPIPGNTWSQHQLTTWL